MDAADERIRARLELVGAGDRRRLAEADELALEQRPAIGALVGGRHVVLDRVEVDEGQCGAGRHHHRGRREAGRRGARSGYDARARRAAAATATAAATT